MIDADMLVTGLVSRVRSLPVRPDPSVRILAYDEALAIAVEEVLSAAGAQCLTLTLPNDIDEALSLVENVLPGADVVVLLAASDAPIRQALEVIAELVLATGLIDPGADSAWGLISGVPVVVLPAERFDALVAAHVLAAPAVRARAGANPIYRTPRAVTVLGTTVGLPRARRFVPGRTSLTDTSVVSPLNEVRSLDAADVLLVIPDSAEVNDGDTIAAIPLHGAW